MRSAVVTPQGLDLLRAALRGSRRPLVRIAAWSVVEASPALVSGWVVAAALDRGFLTGQPLTGLALLGVLAVLYVVRAYAERALFPHLAEVVEPMRDRLVRHLVSATLQRVAQPGWHTTDAADVSRLTRQVESVRSVVATLLRTARTFAVTLLAAAVGLVVLNPLVAAILLPPFTVALLLYSRLLRVLVRRRRRVVLADEGVTAVTGQVLGARRDITALGAESHAVATVSEAAADYARSTAAEAAAGSARILLTLLGGQVPLLGLLLASPWLISHHTLSTGELVGAVTYLTGSLQMALATFTGSTGGLWIQLGAALSRLAEATSVPPGHPTGSAAVPSGRDVRTDHLTFAYGPDAQPVIRDLNITVAPGEHLVIVGPSGIGKSTLAGLLAGVEHPDKGAVLLGGVPITELRGRDRAGTVVLVPQEAYVFPGTVRENLCYLNTDASEEELASAVEALGLARLLNRLGGLDAEITDPAGQASSGERQLLVLARAYLASAAVTILDEASCHLDPAMELHVERAFARRPGTLIVIAHRLASAQRAGRVLLLDGVHADLGTHDELLSRNTRYASLMGHWTPGHRALR